MRKFIVLIALLLFQKQVLFSQTYLPLPDSNVTWIVDVDDGGPGPDWVWQYLTNASYNDTLINSISYAKIFFGTLGNYIGGYRSDTMGKTFYIPADSTQEFLLMNLAANAGDTVYNVLYSYGHMLFYPLQYCVVDSVNYVNDGPYLLKRLYIRFPNAPGGNMGLRWVEKIGPNAGFFNKNPIGLSYITLHCNSFNDTTYYFSSFPNLFLNPVYYHGTCQVPSGIDNINISDSFIIYPNPFSTETILQTNNLLNNATLTVENCFGQRIKQIENISGHAVTLFRDNLPSGLYFVRLTEGNKIIAVAKLIMTDK